MRRTIMLAACLALVVGCAGQRLALMNRAPSKEMDGRVVMVLDGDTVMVAPAEGEARKIRFSWVDAPEKSQPMGPEARKCLEDMVLGKDVRVLWTSEDMYGRIVGNVVVGGLSANSNMVARGMAWQYRAYSKDKGLAGAEKDARDAKLGLWALDNPEAPWDYRKRIKSKKSK